MESTSTRVLRDFLEPPRGAYRRDDEEHEIPPRWLRSRLHAELALTDAIHERLALPDRVRTDGGQ